MRGLPDEGRKAFVESHSEQGASLAGINHADYIILELSASARAEKIRIGQVSQRHLLPGKGSTCRRSRVSTAAQNRTPASFTEGSDNRNPIFGFNKQGLGIVGRVVDQIRGHAKGTRSDRHSKLERLGLPYDRGLRPEEACRLQSASGIPAHEDPRTTTR